MMENNGSASPKLKSLSEKKTLGVANKFWMIGCSCLVFLCFCLVAAVLIYFFVVKGVGGDPIPALAPDDSDFIISVDLLKAQSNEVTDIIQVFRDMVDDGSKGQTPIEALDEAMLTEMHMTFSDDVLPWLGRYAGLIVYDYDINGFSDPELSFIVAVRNKSKADDFIQELVSYLVKENGSRYDTFERNGITYFSISDSDMSMIARSGNYIYFSTSEAAMRRSINLKKADSLASMDGYKQAVAALPKDRLATLYLNGSSFPKYFGWMTDDLDLSSYLGTYSMDLDSIAGSAMSIAANTDGIRLDFATALDPEMLSTFQKDNLNIKYKRSDLEKMVPEDTFFYTALYSSKGPGYLLESGSPLGSPDIQESLDLFDQQYGFNIKEFLNSLTGEYGVAVGPAKDGVLAESMANIGITVIAGTNGQGDLNDIIMDALDNNLGSMGGYRFEPVSYGKYDLQGLIIETISYQDPSLIFGEDQGYFVLGTSPSNLSKSLDGTHSLADSDKYRQTWKAFSAGSIPVLYVDLVGLVDFIEEYDPYTFEYELSAIPGNVHKIPVIAMTIDKPSKYVSSGSIMLFVETVK